MPKLTDADRTRALALLRQEADRTSNEAAARRIGMDRATVSLVVRGKYNANPDRVLSRALLALDRHHCPYLGFEIEHAQCLETHGGPVPTWDPSALAQRRSCQTCSHKGEHHE